MSTPKTIADLPLHVRAHITGFCAHNPHDETRLREIGFAEGDYVEIVNVGLFGRSPLNIRLHGCTSIAMRPREAAMVLVKLCAC